LEFECGWLQEPKTISPKRYGIAGRTQIMAKIGSTWLGSRAREVKRFRTGARVKWMFWWLHVTKKVAMGTKESLYWTTFELQYNRDKPINNEKSCGTRLTGQADHREIWKRVKKEKREGVEERRVHL